MIGALELLTYETGRPPQIFASKAYVRVTLPINPRQGP